MEARTLNEIHAIFAEALAGAFAETAKVLATEAYPPVAALAQTTQQPASSMAQPYQSQPPMAQPYQSQPPMGTVPVQQPVAAQQTQPAMQQQSVAQQAPPVVSQPPVAGMVPTTAVAQEYTQDQLAVACRGLGNQGKQMKLLQLLQGFGVAALVDLPKERYGEFATALRAEGAVI